MQTLTSPAHTYKHDINIMQFGSLADLFSFNMARFSNDVAIVDKNIEYTYEELRQAVESIAYELNELNLKPKECVTINLKPSFKMISSLLAVMQLGCHFILLDQNNTKSRNEQILSDSNTRVLITEGECDLNFSGQKFSADSLRSVTDLSLSARAYPKLALDDLAYMVYTSGSTGTPKGVLISHEGIMSYLQTAINQYYHTQLEGTLLVASPSFDMGITSILIPLCLGHKIVIMDMTSITIRAGRFLNSKQSGNLLIRITPTGMKSILLASGKKTNDNNHTFVIGGENFATSLAEQINKVFPSATIWNHYGPTECVVGCTLYQYKEEISVSGNNLPCGVQMRNSVVLILDPQTRLPVGQGEVGEIYIGKDALSLGYYNNTQLTAKHFIHTDKTTGSSLPSIIYKTGDLGYFNNIGELVFCGRIDNQSKVNGYRFEMEEIESVIIASKLVSTTVVINQDGTSKNLTAFIQPIEKNKLISQELIGYLEQFLPSYAIPGTFKIVKEWPITSNGKIDRKALCKGEVHV
ncbi:hypothetical protein N473_17805 [Pseudoalteromonas luteoviolacea CPMOR-1]|uniref:AMP-dependent synthetase/ligase domain-containing protein n=1 Tax=Pseudoalteromonas luteoviolacea CPMOR-1 TaxID=1365248 RepID=A0A167KUD0_9GAMM|nr:amino acid adenylation domain-containing protein [Pseudoalteromonas luteoviolacea]KZN63284.1 hypothetical protein N473_17805 [Pseudoalteromonas luteoviolacea CPMOR-1]